MTKKHTPGPLVVKSADNGDVAVRTQAERYIVAECFADIRHPSEEAREEALANATLYAAAPDLLNAARAAADCIDELWPRQARVEVVQLLEAAIAKATGAAS